MPQDVTRIVGKGPIVIGGSGGSGTRALAEFLYRNGVDMPKERNSAYDCVLFTEFLRRWMDAILAVTRGLDYRFEDLPETMRRAVADDLAATMAAMRATLPHQNRTRWGWKCPRNVMVLPVLAALVPDVVFVHLVRDGRDMLLSENQNQARRFTGVLTGGLYFRDPRRGAAATWVKVNGEVAAFGEAVLGPRYLRVRYEDLCEPSSANRKALLLRLKLRRRVLDGIFEPSPGTGRWRSQPSWRVRPLHRTLAPALLRFGYLNGDEFAALHEGPLQRLRRRLLSLLPRRPGSRRRRRDQLRRRGAEVAVRQEP
jgi:hypothetical protein